MAEMPVDAVIEAVGPSLEPKANVYRTPPTQLRAPALIAEPGTPWFVNESPARFPNAMERWQIWAVVNSNAGDEGIEWMRAAALAIQDAAASRGIILETVDPPVVQEHAGTTYWATRVGLKATTEV